MIVADIVKKVCRTIQTSEFDKEEVIDLINEMVSDITEARNIPIPGFETSQTVACDGTVVMLPYKFSSNLYFASVPDGRKVWVCPSMQSLLRRFPTAESKLVSNDLYVCIRGRKVEVRPKYTGNIELFFYTSPDEVAGDQDFLPFGEDVPKYLQIRLAHAYCCKELSSDIENGLEGPSPNMDRHEVRYERAVLQLKSMLKHGQSRPEPIRDPYTFQRV